MIERLTARVTAVFCVALLTALAAASAALPVHAGEASFVIRAGRIMPVSEAHPWVIENGVIIVRDGRIEAIGADLELPPDLPVIDLPDAVIMPGLVSAATTLAGRHSGEESIGAGYAAIDAFDTYGDYRAALAGGVTTAHLNPGWHRLVSGRGAVVRLGGDHDARILRAESDLTINLGGAIYNPRDLMKLLVPPTGDTPITPSTPQRPESRMSQYLALQEAIQLATTGEPEKFDVHQLALRAAWTGNAPLRIQAQRSVDLSGAISFLSATGRSGYFVGGLEAAEIADAIRDAGIPLVYTIDESFRAPGRNLGDNPEALDANLDDLAQLHGVRLALALAPGGNLADLRLAAATARRAGLSEQQILAAITRVPAELLQVGDRVGSLDVGKYADLLVLTGHPLETSSHLQRVYLGGRLAHEAGSADALVVKAGTIWLGPDNWLKDGQVLIEDGRITAVGRTVPHPPHARVIDAGPDAFATPGFIDGLGHLGLDGDRGAPATQISLSRLIGPSGLADHRVARAGVTTVMMAPYAFSNTGSQISAVKTSGSSRESRVVKATAAVAFNLAGTDYKAVAGRLKPRLEAGKKYMKLWEDHAKALEEWEKKRAAGELIEEGPKTEESVTEEEPEADPVTGMWEVRVSGGPLPEEAEAKVALKLTGTKIEGRIVEPEPPMEVKITGTLDGTKMSGVLEVETGGQGEPAWEVELDSDDHFIGKLTVGSIFEIDVEGSRIDKGDVEFKVVRSRRKTTGKDGRPLPPKVDEALEPIRAILEKKIPAVVSVSDGKQIAAVLDVLVDQYELNVVLIGAPGAHMEAARLSEKKVGVVLPPGVLRREDNQWYHQGDDLARRGVPIAFQSNAEDAARTLPTLGLFAVERGMSAEAALAALTIDAATMYHIDDRVGRIAPGCDGDLVIFSGHPFESQSSILRVIVNGNESTP